MALAASTSAPGAVKRSRKPYIYQRLSDLRLGSGPVNMMGIAVLFKPPYQSKGRDFSCTMELVDEGCPNSPVPLIFFNREKEKLPSRVIVGDVVCVRRVEVGEFNHRVQGKCRNQCSWLVWTSEGGGGGGGGGGGRAPTFTSEGASWDTHEMTRADKLLTWSVTADWSDTEPPGPSNPPVPVPQSSPPRASSSSLLPLSDITIVDYKINIIGVVKSVSLPQKSRGPDYFISVVLIDETSPSDGFPLTLFSPVESQLPQVGEPGSVAYLTYMRITEYEGNMLGCGHERSRVVVFSTQPDSNGEMLCTGGEVPSNVRQRAEFLLEWVATAQPALDTLEPSQLPPESQDQGSINITPPPPPPPPPPPAAKTPSVSVTSGISSGPIFNPPTFLTVMFHPTWPLTTLKDVQDSATVPSGFRVRVKILKVAVPLDECFQLRCPKCKHQYPPSPLEEEKMCVRCSEVGEPVNLRYMYILSLLIGDSSGATSLAHLSDTDADSFFQNLPPADLKEDTTTRESLLDILTLLCGGQDPFPLSCDLQCLLLDKSRPWIDCCVQTYPSQKGTQIRIFDTWYIGSPRPQ